MIFMESVNHKIHRISMKTPSLYAKNIQSPKRFFVIRERAKDTTKVDFVHFVF